MRRPRASTLVAQGAFLLAALLGGCEEDTPPNGDYYDRVIQPILNANCSFGTSGCHSADPNDPFAFAAGNLDTTSFENVHRRPDLLRTYGAYPVPMFLIKAVGPTDELQIAYRDEFLPIEIPHAGGGLLSVGSDTFLTLQTWLENGATRDGVAPPPAAVQGEGGCSTGLPDDFDPAQVTSTQAWQMHQGEFDAVQAVLQNRGCNAGTCHGAPQADFYVTCGDTAEQKAFNFRQVWAFVDSPVDDSELLERPLAPAAGGIAHAGGVHFTSRTDPDYETIRSFAEKVGPLDFGGGDPGKEFFANHVMPVLLKRGCASEGCHSPAAMNDFKLRAGTQGFFSAIALERNYDLLRREFLAFEVPDVRRGRAVAKNILPVFGGIAHRGGPLLETPGSGGSVPERCPQPFDPATSSAFCVFVEWARIERQAAGHPNSGPTLPIVYVDRQATHVASPLAFDTYQPGSDLRVVDATVDASGRIVSVGTPRSLLSGCAGAGDRAVVDVRSPDVRLDGTTVAFAMRVSATEPLQIWKVQIDGTGCQRLTSPQPGAHRFDPAWSPDGEWIVYASSEAGGTSLRTGLPQSDLYRMRADGSGVERITFLSNSEIQPAFMREGRITMTTEKVDPSDPSGGFYQLAGRRMNWDLTDYHPLLAQRAFSPVNPADPADVRPSVGYAQATEIREGLDGDFLLVLSDVGARAGAGTLAVFNRSVGTFEEGRRDPGYLPSMTIPDPGATGRAGTADAAYRSPFPLLDGRILASRVAGPIDVTTATAFDFDLVAVDPRTGEVETILGGAGQQVEAVLALTYAPRKLYYNRRQLVFGGRREPSDPDHAVVHFPDAPMLATVLGSNLRRGRFVDRFADADTLLLLDGSGRTLGSVPLREDGSARVRVPAATPVVIALARGAARLFTMTEEHQFGPGEQISLGVSRGLFDHVCGGCHGSVSGRELDVSVKPDALTGASISLSSSESPTPIGN